jgi:hypothetical protein
MKRPLIKGFLLLSLILAAVLAVYAVTGKKRSRPNILFIVIDAWRYDHFSPELTPNIWKFAQGGTVFEEYHVNAGYTRPSMAAIFASQYPQFDSVGSELKWSRRMGMTRFSKAGLLTSAWGGEMLPPELPTFPEILRKDGYRTILVTHNGNIGVESGYGSNQWDTLIDFAPAGKRAPWPESGAVALTDQVLIQHKMNSHRPFLLFALYVDMHIPYNPVNTSAETRELLREYAWRTIDNWETGGKERRAELMPLAKSEYQNAARYVDSQIARLLDQVDLTDTITIITTDHGEMFSLTEKRGLTHHGLLPREIVHVPLIVVGPGIPAAHEPRLVQSVDLMPTILELAGAESPDSVVGQDLFLRGYRSLDAVASTPFETAIITQDSIRRMPAPQEPTHGEIAENLRALGYLD